MSIVKRLATELVLNAVPYEESLKGAQESTKAFGQKIQGAMGGAAGAIAGVAAGFAAGAAAAAYAGKQITDLAAKAEGIRNLSVQTGLTTESVQQLSRVAQNAGKDFGSISGAMRFLQRNIVDGDKAFKELGISLKEIRAASPDDQLRMTVKALTEVQDPARQTALGMATMGRGFVELKPVLGDIASGFDNVAVAMSDAQINAMVDGLDAAMDDATGAMDDLWDQMWVGIAASPQLAEAVRGIAQGIRKLAEIAQWAAPIITSALGGALEGIVKAIGTAVLKTEQLGTVISLLMKGQFKDAWAVAQGEVKFDWKMGGLPEAPPVRKGGGGGAYGEEAEIAKLLADAMKTAKVIGGFQTTGGRTDYMQDYLPESMQRHYALAGANVRNLGAASSMMQPKDVSAQFAGFSDTERAIDVINRKTIDWREQLRMVADVAQAMPGWFGKTAQALVGGVATIKTTIDQVRNLMATGGGGIKGLMSSLTGGAGGFGGFLKGLTGAIGTFGPAVSAAVGLGKTIFGGIKKLFGGKSAEEKAAEAEKKRQAEEAAKQAAEEKERQRVAGYDQAASGITKMISALKPATEAGAMAQAGLFSSVFWATVKEKGLVAASAALGDAFKKLTEGASEAMLTYLAPIQQQMNLATSEAFAGATEGAVGLAEALKGMAAMGIISIQDLANASIVATDQYNQALAAAQAQGLEGAAAQQAAIRAVGPAIGEIIKQYQAIGLPLDENLLKLKETAEANGMAFAEDPLVRAANAMERVAAALERAYGGAKGLADEIGRGASASQQYRVPSYRGGGDYTGEEIAAAEGFSGWVNKPTRFLAGESGPEYVSVTPRGEAAAGGGASGITYAPVINISQESAVQTVEGQRAFGQFVTAAVERALDQNFRGLQTRFEELARKVK